MSIQWTIAAAFLYVEILLVVLLVLPLISPKRWQTIFRSRILNAVSSQAQFYFYILLFTLALLLLDAFREMRKYNNSSPDQPINQQLDHEMQQNMRLFRAQRNFYISGFALFLSFVIRRLVTLISNLAALQAQSEAALKQAQNAAATARNLMTGKTALAENTTNEAHDKAINELKEEMQKLNDTLKKERKDKEALKSQAESTNAEYDRLTAEFSKLQKKVAAAEGSGDKKDD